MLMVLVGLILAVPGCIGAVPRAEGPTEEGEQAPIFVLPSAEFGEVALQTYRGRQWVLLYFSMGPG